MRAAVACSWSRSRKFAVTLVNTSVDTVPNNCKHGHDHEHGHVHEHIHEHEHETRPHSRTCSRRHARMRAWTRSPSRTHSRTHPRALAWTRTRSQHEYDCEHGHEHVHEYEHEHIQVTCMAHDEVCFVLPLSHGVVGNQAVVQQCYSGYFTYIASFTFWSAFLIFPRLKIQCTPSGICLGALYGIASVGCWTGTASCRGTMQGSCIQS